MMKTLKRIMQVLGFLLLAIALLYVTMRITGHIVLKDFYDYATRELPIPGLFDGFTPQGLELDEKTIYNFWIYRKRRQNLFCRQG